jgi:hypothetical protein
MSSFKLTDGKVVHERFQQKVIVNPTLHKDQQDKLMKIQLVEQDNSIMVQQYHKNKWVTFSYFMMYNGCQAGDCDHQALTYKQKEPFPSH